jgi:hypothetical protein
MDRVSLRDGFSGGGLDDAGVAAESDATFHEGDGVKFEEVVISGSALVFDVGCDEGEEEAAVFHFRVGETGIAHEFGAAHFEPFQWA